MVGGMSNGAFLGSTGRSVVCAADPVIAGGFAELGCITLGNGPPWGANGTGILTTLTVQALSSAVGTQPCGGPNPGTWVPCFPRGITSVPLVSPNTQVLRIDGVDIAADVVSGSRRVMICPDANPHAR